MNIFLTLLSITCLSISVSFAQNNTCGKDLVGEYNNCTTITSVEADVLKAESVRISEETGTSERKLFFYSKFEYDDLEATPLDLLNDLNYPIDFRYPCKSNFMALVSKDHPDFYFTFTVSGETPKKILTTTLNAPDIQATMTCHQK